MSKSQLSSVVPLLGAYSLVVLLYSIFSYSLTDPNLVLSQWNPYWQFQQWMWTTFFHNSQLMTCVFIGLVALLFGLYIQIVRVLQRSSIEFESSWKKYFLIYGLVILPIFFSYNALSHDVFNYIFNAKMVAVYHVNPHTTVSLNYPDDLWVRFMHNTHTAAPYGYGWTAISLIPYMLGFGKFILTWLSFRVWSLISMVLLYAALQYSAKIFFGARLQAYQLALIFLNPLFLIEVASNMHNDIWMMAPAIVSIAILTALTPNKLPELKRLLLALLLLGISISIKLVTVVLLPLAILILIEKNFLFRISVYLGSKLPVFKAMPAQLLTTFESKLYRFVPFIASLLLFIPLFTARSQQFLPWYLMWILVWLPFIESKIWRTTIVLFSLSSMLRYVPWLWTGGFDGNVFVYQKLITWLPVGIYLLWKLLPLSVYSYELIPRKDSNLK
jgi:hypothetical protein